MVNGQSHPRPAIQLWLPFNSFSMYDEEFSYALGKAALEWRKEDRIWFLPYIKESRRWSNPRLPIVKEMALPSTSFNVITIMHINQEKQIFPTNTVGVPKDWIQVPEDLFISF